MLLVLLCSLFSQGQVRDQQARRDQQPVGAVSISGRAQAATGAAIQGAVIVLVTAPLMESHSSGRASESAQIEGRSAMTDASGGFSFSGVAPGAYRLIVSPAFHQGRYLPSGHGASRPNDPGRTITVRAGEDIRDLTLTLPAGVAIEGRVMDEAGEPLSRMSVLAARVMAGSDGVQRVGHEPATTDDLGRYRIYGLEPGEYVVAVEGRSVPVAGRQRPGVRPSLTEQELMAFLTTFHPSTLVESSAQRIQLVPGRDAVSIDIAAVRARRVRVSGVVLDSQGVPVASANGVLSRAGGLAATSHGFTADAAGRFAVAAVEPGEYTLAVGGGTWSTPIASTGRPETAELPMTIATDADDIVVVTQPGTNVSGRVILSDAAAASAPQLRIAFRRGDGSILRSVDVEATIGEDLRFLAADLFGPRLVRVSGLPNGWGVKAVMLNGADITDVPTVFTKEHDGQLQVVLGSRLSTLEGEVRDDAGRAVDDAMVYVFSEERTSWSLASPRTIFSDVRADGRFRVGGLTGGRYFAIAVAREGLRLPQSPRAAFFELLSKEATPFVIGDDERRTLELRLWRWPE
jgi:protocatechuate 3,4-dioxygenase beta subunit